MEYDLLILTTFIFCGQSLSPLLAGHWPLGPFWLLGRPGFHRGNLPFNAWPVFPETHEKHYLRAYADTKKDGVSGHGRVIIDLSSEIKWKRKWKASKTLIKVKIKKVWKISNSIFKIVYFNPQFLELKCINNVLLHAFLFISRLLLFFTCSHSLSYLNVS